MRRLTLAVAVLVGVLLGGFTSSAHAAENLIQDGDFDFYLPYVPPGGFAETYWGAFGAWEVVLPEGSPWSWPSLGIWDDVIWLQEVEDLPEIGGALIELNGNSPGALQQTVNVTPGENYELSLYQFNNGGAGDVRVVVEDDVAGIIFDETWASPGLDPDFGTVVGTTIYGGTWELLSGSFVATGTELTVRIESRAFDTQWNGTFIDSVSLTAVELTPQEALEQLILDVTDINVDQGIANALDNKLDNVLDAYLAENADQRQDVVNKMEAFINAVEAQRGKKITDEQADYMVGQALEIMARL